MTKLNKKWPENKCSKPIWYFALFGVRTLGQNPGGGQRYFLLLPSLAKVSITIWDQVFTKSSHPSTNQPHPSIHPSQLEMFISQRKCWLVRPECMHQRSKWRKPLFMIFLSFLLLLLLLLPAMLKPHKILRGSEILHASNPILSFPLIIFLFLSLSLLSSITVLSWRKRYMRPEEGQHPEDIESQHQRVGR